MADRLEAATLETWLGEVRDSGRSAMFVGAGVGAFDAASRDGVEYLTNGNVGKSPNSTPDRGGFSGWSMIGVHPEHGMWDDAAGEWSEIEIRPLVDTLEVSGPSVLDDAGSVDLDGTVVQDERRVPASWPVSVLWAGDGETAVQAGAEVPATAVATVEPATGVVAAVPGRAVVDGELVTLGDGEEPGYASGHQVVPVRVSLTVNDATTEHVVQVEVPSFSTEPLLENGFFVDEDWGGMHEHVFRFGRSGDEVFVGDWDGDGADSFALRRGNVFYVRNSMGSGAADEVIVYGRSGDTILVGDWDGDGTDTFAVRRGAEYQLRNSITSGPADTVVTYGRAEDVVLVGDWDGNATDTLAVRRGATYFVRDTLTDGWADTVFTYGRSEDVVLVGDWDGDGLDTFAVRRGNEFLLRDDLVDGDAEITHVYGEPDDEIHVGDWDGSGTDTPAAHR